MQEAISPAVAQKPSSLLIQDHKIKVLDNSDELINAVSQDQEEESKAKTGKEDCAGCQLRKG